MTTSYLYPLTVSLKNDSAFSIISVGDSYEQFIQVCLNKELVKEETEEIVSTLDRDNLNKADTVLASILKDLSVASQYLPKTISSHSGRSTASIYLEALDAHGPVFYVASSKSLPETTTRNTVPLFGKKRAYKLNGLGEDIYEKNSPVSFTEPVYKGKKLHQIDPKLPTLLSLLDEQVNHKPVTMHQNDFGILMGVDRWSARDQLYRLNPEGSLLESGLVRARKFGLVEAFGKVGWKFHPWKTFFAGLGLFAFIVFGSLPLLLSISSGPQPGWSLVLTIGFMLFIAGLVITFGGAEMRMSMNFDEYWELSLTPNGKEMARQQKAWDKYKSSSHRSNNYTVDTLPEDANIPETIRYNFRRIRKKARMF